MKWQWFAVIRALVYASLFVGVLLVYAPAQLLERSGIVQPEVLGVWQVLGMLLAAGGGMLALWCVLTFAFIGRGTPAPFDAPRELVVSGPYRVVRNPMYIGATLALLGAMIYYQLMSLLCYTALFFVLGHLFVVLYEEPHLRRVFGEEYGQYCQRVNRWWPKFN